MREPSGFINPHDRAVRDGALKEFEASWRQYSSPTAAVKAIAMTWGIGRTTLTEWVHDAGKWPQATIAQIRRLEMENLALRRQIETLKKAARVE